MSAGIVDIQRQLIKKAKLGDTKAFSQLYAEIYKDLYRFALYMTKHTQDAEDAVSEAVISAYENISGLKKENSFKSWMFTILNNECKKILRKNGNTSNQVSEEDAKNLGAEEIDFAQRHDVKKAFESLEEEEQTIVAFSVFGGYSQSASSVFPTAYKDRSLSLYQWSLFHVSFPVHDPVIPKHSSLQKYEKYHQYHSNNYVYHNKCNHVGTLYTNSCYKQYPNNYLYFSNVTE